MPRRKNANTTAAQRTLSFNSKSAKVTKPSANDATKNSKKIEKLATAIEEVQDSTKDESESVTLSEVPAKDQIPIVEEIAKDETSLKAEKIPEKALLQYWHLEEEKRKARRVHQEGLSVNDKILRHFDLSSQYGPCVGIPRLKRWKRADTLGLNPPIEVLAVLLKEEKRNNANARQAYMDELMSGRHVIE